MRSGAILDMVLDLNRGVRRSGGGVLALDGGAAVGEERGAAVREKGEMETLLVLLLASRR